MTAARRRTPTSTNGGSDNGIDYTDAVNVEDMALWQVACTELVDVGGTAAAITATSDIALVAPITSLKRPMSFWLTPLHNNPGPTQINIDGTGFVDIVDRDGNDLTEDALVGGRRHQISFDGTAIVLMSAGGSSGGSGGVQDNAINRGRLTILTNVPALLEDVIAATKVFWTNDTGYEISLYDGSSAWNIIPSSERSINFTDTQTGTTHIGTKVIDGLVDTSQLMEGMKISGAGVGAGSVVISIDSPTQITGSVNSTAGATVAITFKVPADTAVDIFGKNVSSSLSLRGKFRAVFNTRNVMARQDGVLVLAANPMLRWLGTVATGAVDGQIDWLSSGQRRFRVWNQDNRKAWFNMETFSASGTWGWTFGIVSVISEIFGGGGNGQSAGNGDAGVAGTSGAPGGYSLKRFTRATLTSNQTVTIGATSSFGANHSATNGANGIRPGGLGSASASGSGVSGDINITGGGQTGGVSAVGDSSNVYAGGQGGTPLVIVSEMVEY